MDFLNQINETFEVGTHEYHVGDIIAAILVLVIGLCLFWVFIRFILRPYLRRTHVDEGREFSIIQLLKYVFYVAIVLAAIQTAGVQINLLLAAGAALLVGVGIGLQQTFNDFVSGIILLSEGTIRKGDWLEVPQGEAQVLRIGLRASLLETRAKVKIIVPNSKITVDTVINLSHENQFIRYSIGVGVAYGSDTRKVKDILFRIAQEHPEVMSTPPPFVRFEAFGESSLDFRVFFWSREFRAIEDVYSDMRYSIDDAFRAENITIPFPQRTLHVHGDSEELPID